MSCAAREALRTPCVLIVTNRGLTSMMRCASRSPRISCRSHRGTCLLLQGPLASPRGKGVYGAQCPQHTERQATISPKKRAFPLGDAHAGRRSTDIPRADGYADTGESARTMGTVRSTAREGTGEARARINDERRCSARVRDAVPTRGAMPLPMHFYTFTTGTRIAPRGAHSYSSGAKDRTSPNTSGHFLR